MSRAFAISQFWQDGPCGMCGAVVQGPFACLRVEPDVLSIPILQHTLLEYYERVGQCYPGEPVIIRLAKEWPDPGVSICDKCFSQHVASVREILGAS